VLGGLTGWRVLSRSDAGRRRGLINAAVSYAALGVASPAFASSSVLVQKSRDALRIFGAGNERKCQVGLRAMGWQAVAQIWAIGLVAIAVLFFLFTKDDP
jgi:hypothetical protein